MTSLLLRAGLALLLSATAAQAQNLLVNGSFEDGPEVQKPPGYLPLDPPSEEITGWVVTRDQIDYVFTNPLEAADGIRSLDLNGTPGAGGVAQTFATLPGSTYSVHFQMAGNPYGQPKLKILRVEIDGGAQGAEFSYDNALHDVVEWEPRTWSFTATSTATTLEFYSATEVSSFGPTLDDVRVVEGACGGVERTCSSMPNSTGSAAWIDFTGSAVIANDDAALEALGCTPSSFGLFVYGGHPASYPFGDGLLCINPFQGLHRMMPPVFTDGAGEAALEIDFEALPAGATIEPGSAWYFQFLYRDGGSNTATFNTTDAVRVLFC